METEGAPAIVGDNTASPGSVDVRLAGVHKRFGEVAAVNGVDLEIMRGEFFTLLGPSGSGKTTCLRMIAGFERPDSGAIELAGRDVTRLPPFERAFPDPAHQARSYGNARPPSTREDELPGVRSGPAASVAVPCASSSPAARSAIPAA